MKRDFLWGFVFGATVFAWINTAPWTDASLYRKARAKCEEKLPRDQYCRHVIGVPDDVIKPAN